MMLSKILLFGGTGAMGVYLVPELINLGFDVFVTSRTVKVSDNAKLTYIQGNAHDNTFVKKTLADSYDAIIDFMVYTTNEFRSRHELLLKSTKHYIFLSSYRVFAESNLPITENSPRLLDVSKDSEYLATDEYALAKARQENILRESQYKNWTIIRPTITYSKTRFQLGTLEADTVVFRALCNCPVIFPQKMLSRQTTMTWAGDVAKMIALLTLNPNALSEDFNVCTDEHLKWEDIAQFYKRLIGLTVIPTNLDIYMKVMGSNSKYQILYDRMYNRVMNNSKIIKTTGIPKEHLTSIHDGLARELLDYPGKLQFIKINYALNARIDKVTHSRISKEKASIKEKIIYYSEFYLFLKLCKKIIKCLLCKANTR